MWLAITKPPAATGYASAVIALLTAFVSWIAFRTVVLAVRPAGAVVGHQADRHSAAEESSEHQREPGNDQVPAVPGCL